jgi:hypothetical protein
MLLIEEKRIPIKIELVPMRSYGDKPMDFMRKVPNGTYCIALLLLLLFLPVTLPIVLLVNPYPRRPTHAATDHDFFFYRPTPGH